jgi:hypothetical protein
MLIQRQQVHGQTISTYYRLLVQVDAVPLDTDHTSGAPGYRLELLDPLTTEVLLLYKARSTHLQGGSGRSVDH